ncbi:SDR family oxidoreductase [Paenisporosarcina cavernae]|uniref:SDR family oxidoreductase n=1 Tax=Paenisporosarcina cavernae TaxID=2320858 RepID=A0A385YUC6_9BACL|nr:SDR family oxidoreductase [Paenisporosarcina cavernae]AYC30286.1 SDR family oxidoreductase [Paenisporosarcina cavernae]
MKALIVGANGQVGKHLVSFIKDQENVEAKVMIRKEEQAPHFKELGVETVMADLEGDIPAIAKAAEGVDAIVFTAGSGPKTGDDKTILVDLDGAVKTIEAAKKAGVKRFIMVSSYDTTREAIQSSDSSFAPYVVAKHYADEWLRATDLDYTIVHPGALTNDSGTGNVNVATKVEPHDIPREDVARVILECLVNESTIGKEFQVVSGDVDVKEAIKSL